jgi:hypothetical protein
MRTLEKLTNSQKKTIKNRCNLKNQRVGTINNQIKNGNN